MTLDLDAYARLLPPITDENRPFWEGCREDVLRMQYCASENRFLFPPAPVCPGTLKPATLWRDLSGRGRLWSWIVMHQRYLAAFADSTPYIVAFIALDEGPFMIASLSGDTEGLACDLPVRAVFEAVLPDRMVPKFEVVR